MDLKKNRSSKLCKLYKLYLLQLLMKYMYSYFTIHYNDITIPI